METSSATHRPYPPPTTLAAVLNRLRSRNLPERIDGEFLKDAGVSETLVTRMQSGLQFLRLVDGDLPTSQLRSIAMSTDEEYKAILSGLIREAYADVFQILDPATDTQDRFINFFRRYSPASQRARMVLFFLGMCREAGIPTVDLPRQRSTSTVGSSKPLRPSGKAPPVASQARPSGNVKPTKTNPPVSIPASTNSTTLPLLFGVTEGDIGNLNDEEFKTVWQALGTIARARSMAKRAQNGADSPESAAEDIQVESGSQVA